MKHAPTSSRSALMDITARPDSVFLRGEGSWLWDDAGRRHLDFVQGWAVNTLGHAPCASARRCAQRSLESVEALITRYRREHAL